MHTINATGLPTLTPPKPSSIPKSVRTLPADHITFNHLTPVLQHLAFCGVTVEDLCACGPHSPLSQQIARAIKTRGWSLTSGESQAVDLLGVKEVFLAEAIAHVWKQAPPPLDHREIHYSDRTLWKCAEENSQGRQWRLCFYLGIPPEKQYSSVSGFYIEKCADDVRTWGKHLRRSHTKLSPGYYLLDWRSRFQNRPDSAEHMPWEEQEAELRKPGYKGCTRASAAQVLEAWIGYLLLTGESSWDGPLSHDHLDMVTPPIGDTPGQFVTISRAGEGSPSLPGVYLNPDWGGAILRRNYDAA